MKFLVLSDIHGASDAFDKLDEEFKTADAVLMAGDFAKFGEVGTGLPVLQALIRKHERLFCVAGNCDEPNFVEELDARDVSIQGSLVYSDSLFFIGSGGALEFTGQTPYERNDDELVSDLTSANDFAEKDNLIAVIHQPPKDTKLDRISAGVHVGSEKVRVFIEEVEPLVAISGHIHESFAIDTLGKTTLINPGSLAEGRYAILEVAKVSGEWKVQKAELRSLN